MSVDALRMRVAVSEASDMHGLGIIPMPLWWVAVYFCGGLKKSRLSNEDSTFATLA